ncbi:protein MULTIPLE CHLOROPLAST DIVISION SITE 1 isoform X1 [Rosa rugosa]|uniref:protein MULTIPLE CHLOROPLAST DIVISION SITE 1 isoform X1 n=1 Tax=Rosa rugosa TaxID=74645 RepID=UPI002B40A711|nr:protein MULTIPLE CHLOROPLAST DIVISION SITE 1 isoform X1 [Rosa rugosa]
MASTSTLQFHSLSFQTSIWVSKHQTPALVLKFRPELGSSNGRFIWARRLKPTHRFLLRAIDGSGSSNGENPNAHNDENYKYTINLKDPVDKFHGMISSVSPIVFKIRQRVGSNLAIGLCIATAFLVVALRVFMVRKSKNNRQGSVADLVRRGQLRSDRRGISKPLMYDDPFNNPLVKVGKGNSTIEMCGKVYRLAPITLTKEEQAIHRKRRSRAYQWKRPTMFLKEGDSIPADVDPDTIRWIPSNHPFATTAGDIDEDLAQTNVYQKHGVPYRIQAEHEALQREQKESRLVMDSSNATDPVKAFKSGPKSPEHGEENLISNEGGDSKPPLSERASNSSSSMSSSEERHKP